MENNQNSAQITKIDFDKNTIELPYEHDEHGNKNSEHISPYLSKDYPLLNPNFSGDHTLHFDLDGSNTNAQCIITLINNKTGREVAEQSVPLNPMFLIEYNYHKKGDKEIMTIDNPHKKPSEEIMQIATETFNVKGQEAADDYLISQSLNSHITISNDSVRCTYR